jgi:hypothetical protein
MQNAEFHRFLSISCHHDLIGWTRFTGREHEKVLILRKLIDEQDFLYIKTGLLLKFLRNNTKTLQKKSLQTQNILP